MAEVSAPRRRRAVRGAGDLLRDEILDATTDLVFETGNSAKSVSIRAVAQRVGVTPPSIYLDFDDKDALLDAVCARYFEKLDEEMQRAATGQTSTLEVLRAQGRAYIRFAIDTPQLYRIATMGESKPGSGSDAAVASSAFTHMRASVQALMDEGIYAPGDATDVALELWTAAHGVAALMIAKPHLPFGDVEEFTDRVMGALCCGQIILGRVPADATPEETVGWLAGQRPAPGSGEGTQR